MSEPDKTQHANQTSRTTANSGHMTTNSGQTKSEYDDAHQKWIISLTTEERAAYDRGYEDGRRCSGIEWLHSVNKRIEEHQRRIRAAAESEKA